MQLEQQELEVVRNLNSEFNGAKLALGEIEIKKHQILRQLEGLKEEFARHESLLVEKYGADAVINLQTGEVTKKEN